MYISYPLLGVLPRLRGQEPGPHAVGERRQDVERELVQGDLDLGAAQGLK